MAVVEVVQSEVAGNSRVAVARLAHTEQPLPGVHTSNKLH
jgi:hypothetical protein